MTSCIIQYSIEWYGDTTVNLYIKIQNLINLNKFKIKNKFKDNYKIKSDKNSMKISGIKNMVKE